MMASGGSIENDSRIKVDEGMISTWKGLVVRLQLPVPSHTNGSCPVNYFEHSLKFTTHSCLLRVLKPSHLQSVPLSANLQTSPVDGVFLLSVPEPELESGLSDC